MRGVQVPGNLLEIRYRIGRHSVDRHDHIAFSQTRQIRDAGPVYGYDLHTGKLAKKVPLGNIFKTYHHHRCYRNKATLRYIIASRRGSEFVDLEEGNHSIHNWVFITVPYPGAAPAETESMIIDPIESEIQDVDKIVFNKKDLRQIETRDKAPVLNFFVRELLHLAQTARQTSAGWGT